MNNYRAKSQQYQIFVTSELLCVNINKIIIPKLDIQLEYDIEDKQYKFIKHYLYTSKDSLLKGIETRRKKQMKPLWYEINHFIIEDNLISLIQSSDILNQKLASELLLLKLENIKL